MELLIFTPFFCSSAECSSPAATASRRRRQRSEHRLGDHDQVPVIFTAAGNRLATTIKYLRGAAGIDLGTTTKYLAQCLCVEPELPP
jgi:hypothetical protein